MKILVVHQRVQILRNCETYLRRAGHEVHTAYDGAEAAEKLQSHYYDLVISAATLLRMGLDDILSLLDSHVSATLLILLGKSEVVHDRIKATIPTPFRPASLVALVATLL